jgi:NAD(P)-dependent dehydrogenase (short-subunit alcohol dehydrogenase family)
MALDIKGKTALVTGAGSGICLAFAKRLLSSGCNVLVADLRLSPEAEKELHTAGNSAKAVYVETDVTKWDQLQRAFDSAMSNFGRLDIVCPGAGIFEPVRSCFTTTFVVVLMIMIGNVQLLVS